MAIGSGAQKKKKKKTNPYRYRHKSLTLSDSPEIGGVGALVQYNNECNVENGFEPLDGPLSAKT
jgi:hypothetical protein